jgi:hypothetical protein
MVATDWSNRRFTCPTCTRFRTVVRERRRYNEKINGRHPRETMISVDVAPLRARYEELVQGGHETAYSVARAAGYSCPDRREPGRRKPDTQRLKRRLGITPMVGKAIDPETGRRVQTFSEYVDYETALVLCRALGVEYPADMGI